MVRHPTRRYISLKSRLGTVSVPSMSNIAPRSTREPLVDMALTLVDVDLLPHRAAVLNAAREAPAETERMQLEEAWPSRWSAASGAPIQGELVRGGDHVASRGHTSLAVGTRKGLLLQPRLLAGCLARSQPAAYAQLSMSVSGLVGASRVL